MTDSLDPERRSWNMSRIRGKDTKPELAVRKALHAAGYRFRLHVKELPGKPDIVLPKWKTAVFVHGCFWHSHDGCKDATIPKTRTEWWVEKLSKNKIRDTLNCEALVRAGWHILIVWDCSFKQAAEFSDIELNRFKEIAFGFIVTGSGIFEISSNNMNSSNKLCNKKSEIKEAMTTKNKKNLIPIKKSISKKGGLINRDDSNNSLNNISEIQVVQETDNEAKLTAKLIKKKLAAARSRGEFRTVDLFAGCGGLSLGFDRAGFRSICAVELNDDARKSHELNFGSGPFAETYRSFADIKSTEPADAVAHIRDSVNSTELAADIVIGGPPCQAFSRLGRAALWSLAGEKFAHEHDERATMYHYFLHYVATLKPLAFVMENVREIGKHVGKNIAEEIAVTAEALGYTTNYTLLNAVWFGVPQLRERMFIIGIHKSLKKQPVFPSIQFRYELPVGYSTSRAGEGSPEVCLPCDHYVDHCEKTANPLQATSVATAFTDLPPILHHLDGRRGKGHPRSVSNLVEYEKKNNWFTTEMRTWPRFENKSKLFTGHVIRYTPRDYEIFRRMPHDGMYPEALIVAEEIFQERLQSYELESGKTIKPGSEEWESIRKAVVPPYKDGRYPNKFRKMSPGHPSRTLPAHIGKDSYSHIHFDSDQARGISLREAARIQSFPDAFNLAGSMNSQLKQIGNAVPPLLAYAVAQEVRRALLD